MLDSLTLLINYNQYFTLPVMYFPPQNGSTPLHIAAEKGHLDAITVLLSHNADGTIKDKVLYLVSCIKYTH